jgi:uncharacterized protein
MMSKQVVERVILATALSLLMSIPVNAAPFDGPSFDCRKAVSVPERTICADAALSHLDLQLGQIWRKMLEDFDLDGGQATQIRSGQRVWIVSRNECRDDAKCLGKLYRDRLSVLNGSDPAYRFSGEYEVKSFGALTLYPIGSRYLVTIQTAHPIDASWVCQLNGEAKPSGDDLEITVGDSLFKAHLRDAATLVIPNDESTQNAAQKYCGLNGTFAESYHRVHR